MLDRRPIVENWMWWATFHVTLARTGDVHAAGVAARNALVAVWNGPK